MIKTLSKIYQFSGKMQETMKKAILFSVLHSLFDMMSFGALAMVFSGLTDGFTTSMIWMIFGITLASMLLKIYCSYISDFGKVQIGYFMCAEKRIHIGDRMKYMPMGYFNDHNLGNLTSVVTTTMGDIENNASMVLTNILGGYIHAAIITIVMLCIDWRIGLTILCGILLFTWCIGRLQKKSETVSPQRQQAQEALVSNVLEYVQGMLIVKSFNLGQNSNSKMRQAILDSKDKNLKLERTFVPYNMLQQIILYGTSILVIVEGLYFYLNGTMALSICLLMTVASFMLFSQLQSAGNTSALLRLLDVSIDKVNEIDKTPVMDEHGKPVKPENYNIVFDDVSFSYGEHQVLDHVSLTIPERTVTAIVGPSGAGKSTMIKLILKEINPTSGSIYVNGYHLNKLRRRRIPALRRTIGFVFQDFRLIPSMTVYENVAFVLRVIDAPTKYIRKRVPYVIGLVGLQEKAYSYPDELSGGEMQRVAIARALVNDPQLIIADEPTGNIDPELSYEIVELLQGINDIGTTVLMVTHEHSLVRQFGGRIINIDQGRIVFDEVIGGNLIHEG